MVGGAVVGECSSALLAEPRKTPYLQNPGFFKWYKMYLMKLLSLLQERHMITLSLSINDGLHEGFMNSVRIFHSDFVGGFFLLLLRSPRFNVTLH